MTVASAPIKVNVDTDQLISHAAHFLGKAKKDVVDIAVREYIEAHRSEINEVIRAALDHLDDRPSLPSRCSRAYPPINLRVRRPTRRHLTVSGCGLVWPLGRQRDLQQCGSVAI